MELKRQVEKLFQPLIGQRAWRASVGWGSFVTLEFGRKRLYNHHFHGDWHLWLYQCDWNLTSNGRCMAHSESKKRMMQLAIDNLSGAVLTEFSFNAKPKVSEFTFENDRHLKCSLYADATPDEDYWILFMPDRQTASLRETGLRYEAADAEEEKARRSPASQSSQTIKVAPDYRRQFRLTD